MKISKKKIEKLQDSGLYLYLAEAGAGLGLSQRLLSVEGASKLIWKTECCYAKSSQVWLEGTELRSISAEAISEQLSSMAFTAHLLTTGSERQPNIFMANSFQVGKDICNHGWVGVLFKGDVKYYHFTFEQQHRRFIQGLVRDVQFALLEHCVHGTTLDDLIGLDDIK
jgi:hypothetical protein